MLQEFYSKLDAWAIVGLVAQIAFASRFIVQWIASERRGESIIPISFWYLSLIGTTGLLLYAIVRADPVFILGQSFGSIIYTRNLMLIYRRRAAEQASTTPAA